MTASDKTQISHWQGLWQNNPALVQLLGLCPLLAVSTTVIHGLFLGIATVCVLTLGNTCISLCRGFIPQALRLPCFMLILGTVTTITELTLQAMHYQLYQQVGLFIPLILTNCTLLARAEAVAFRNGPWYTALDSFGMGLGFALVLITLGGLRELLTPWSTLAVLPVGAFIIFSLFIALQQYIGIRKTHRQQGRHKRIPVVAVKSRTSP